MIKWDKVAKVIAKILEYLWDVFIWALVFGAIYLIYVLGGMEGDFLDKIKQLPDMIRSGELAPTPGGGPKLNYYTILLGSAKSRSSADQIAQRARSKRINTQILQRGKTFYVISGKYFKKSQAEPRLKTIRSKGFSRARILEPE